MSVCLMGFGVTFKEVLRKNINMSYNLITRPHSTSPIVGIISLIAKGFCSGSHIAFSCHVPLVPNILKWFLSLLLTFMILTHLKSFGQLFCRTSINLGFMTPHNQIQGMHLWQECHRSDVAFFSLYPIEMCYGHNCIPHHPTHTLEP